MVSVSIVMGSDSDRELGEKAKAVLDDFGVENELVVHSAHRSPGALREYVASSQAAVFIAVAGLSAALPGFIAAHTVKPVIGVPKDVKLGGLDSLLSMVQMPPGVPVACVGIDNARNAALLAVEILALSDVELEKKFAEHREKMRG
ncbi:MAG: 5-(carboxyamino)imidazole ribonucleotide mutase [Candidatus Bathyarchaeota archaeon]|nr:5-(carboxyamino)imidazole ribonucleotide mutase [Candidatus Bathyarchaeota archaeon]MDH5791083.1 5-(carboxyamino)imidazole ribonucleotide mutase [Candidatus Bathyarchaeota archaeon]